MVKAVTHICKHYYLRRFGESRSSNGSTPSVRLSVRALHFWGALFVKSVNPKVFIPFIQTLPYDCSANPLCANFKKVVLWRSRESNLRPLVYKTYVYPLHHGGFT